MTKLRAPLGDLEGLRFEPLPDSEDLAVITEGRGTGSGFELLRQYHRLLDLALQLWQYHFEFLNLGYAAYLDFFGFCKQAFPNIPDLAIAKMVAGVEVDLFQPDEELKKLARLAVGFRVDGAFDQPPAAGGRGGVLSVPMGGSGPAVVQLLVRERLLPHRRGVAGAPGDPLRVRPRLHRQAARRGRHRPGHRRPPRRAGPGG